METTEGRSDQQAEFINKVNRIILKGKEQGFSTNGISDKWHTFGELYYHRMVLFSVICNQNKEKAWKSKLHSDGTMFEDSFNVGINTPEGTYSYHYHTDCWDYFDVKELDQAPEYDGHQPKDITRLWSLLKGVE